MKSYNKVTLYFFGSKKNLLQKNQTLQETRDLLLPRLNSGELEVSGMETNEPENLSMSAEPAAFYNE